MLLQGTQSHTKNQRNESQAGPTYFLCAKCLIIRLGSSQAVQWLGLLTSTARGIGLIPNQVTKIPHAVQWGQKKKKTILNEFFLCFYICSLGASGFLHLHYSHEERFIEINHFFFFLVLWSQIIFNLSEVIRGSLDYPVLPDFDLIYDTMNHFLQWASKLTAPRALEIPGKAPAANLISISASWFLFNSF